MNRKNVLPIVLLLFIACTPRESIRQTSLETATPKSSGFSSERLARLDNTMNDWGDPKENMIVLPYNEVDNAFKVLVYQAIND